MRLTARGFTVVEVLISLSLWGLVSGITIGTFLAVNRGARRQFASTERREMLRTAAEFVAGELRAAATGPVLPGPGHVVYGMPRWTSVTCDWPRPSPDGLELRLLRSATVGMGIPVAERDSADVWAEGYPSSQQDDRWIRGAVVDVLAAECADGRAALAVRFSSLDPLLTSLAVHPGAPIVGFQMAALRGYQSGDGAWWLGHATADQVGWHTIQPLAGPFARRGVQFALEDDGRAATVVLRTPSPDEDSLSAAAAIRGRER